MPSYRYDHGDQPLEGYSIEHALGRGGFGEVYYAVSDSGRQVALKAVQNYEDIELRGISHCMNLKSPHLVSIFDVKHNDRGDAFVIMEYVAGPSLRELLDESPDGLGTEKAAWFVREMAKGLALLHDAGVVHRDLKPHNVFVEDGYVKVGDYSLSKIISASHRSGHTMTVGTVHYMAPEISLGRYDKTVDIYALGVMLYEMLTGRPPHTGETMGEVLMKHMSGDIDVSGIEDPFASVVLKAMAQDPADRYQSVDEMVEALFGAEHIQDSVSGFNPQSLTVLAGRAARAAEIAHKPTKVPEDTWSISKLSMPKPKTIVGAVFAFVCHWFALISTIGRGFAVGPYPRRTYRRISFWDKRQPEDRRPVAFIPMLVVFLALGLMVAITTANAASTHVVWFTVSTAVCLTIAVQLVAVHVTPAVPSAPTWFHRLLFALPVGLVMGLAFLLFDDFYGKGGYAIVTVAPFLILDWRWLVSSVRPSRFVVLPVVLAGAIATVPCFGFAHNEFPISGLIVVAVALLSQLFSPFDSSDRNSRASSGWLRELDSVFQTRYGDADDDQKRAPDASAEVASDESAVIGTPAST